jgi:hypothetical protein
MTAITPATALETFLKAAAVLVNGEGFSNVVADFLWSGIENDPENEWLRVAWVDEAGTKFYLIFTEQVVYIDEENKSFVMYDDEGDKFLITPLGPIL